MIMCKLVALNSVWMKLSFCVNCEASNDCQIVEIVLRHLRMSLWLKTAGNLQVLQIPSVLLKMSYMQIS